MSSAFNRHIGQHLKRARKLRGLTQQQLATQLGVSFQQVQKYEAGTNTLTFERVLVLGALLGVPLEEWAAAGRNNAPQPTPQMRGGGRQELNLLQTFHTIESMERRTLLCQLARVIAEASGEAA